MDQFPHPWGGSVWVIMGGSPCPPLGGSAWALLVDHLPAPRQAPPAEQVRLEQRHPACVELDLLPRLAVGQGTVTAPVPKASCSIAKRRSVS